MRLKILLLIMAMPLMVLASGHGGSHEVSMTNSDFFIEY